MPRVMARPPSPALLPPIPLVPPGVDMFWRLLMPMPDLAAGTGASTTAAKTAVTAEAASRCGGSECLIEPGWPGYRPVRSSRG